MMKKLKFDEAELRSRRNYYDLRDEDLARLAGLRGWADRSNQLMVDRFYELILGHPEARLFFPDEATVRRVKELQKRYFVSLFAGRCDLPYVEDRIRVGMTHERIGMPPKFYLGSYALYLRLADELLTAELGAEASRAPLRSLEKLVFFDMSLAIDAYVAASMETLDRHQRAIRELSTPVITLFDRVLLLPIVGTIDTQRAQQIMETALTRVVHDKAKVMILDIAGVPVVDTKVADHLLQTTGALKLLGAEVILTGISPQVARTVIRLGVNVSTLTTSSSLADGVEMALGIIGLRIEEQRPRDRRARVDDGGEQE
jgi:rsbT co-antagonist protein RsbR